jgi:hypothetical protein
MGGFGGRSLFLSSLGAGHLRSTRSMGAASFATVLGQTDGRLWCKA